MGIRSVLIGILTTVVCLAAPTAARAERLCDPAGEDCRAILLNLIKNERVGIDVAFWFMEDARYSAELIRRAQAGVPVRVIFDPAANAGHPVNAQIVEQLRTAGIPLRRRNASAILHWKAMVFAGQGQVEFSGANYSPNALVADDPYRNYVDEAIFFTEDAAIVQSFMRKFDDLWTNTTTYANYANISGTLKRNYPTYAIAHELNFPPSASYRDRAVSEYNAERTGIDVIMYRITDRTHSDAMIAAVNRGVPVRLITEPLEYRNANRLWVAWNLDRLWMAGVQIRDRAHAGLNHQKSVILHSKKMTIFGSSNWTTPSNQAQEEHNLFTTRAWMYDWFTDQFNRKWNNTGPAVETQRFRPLPPGEPTYSAPANTATGVSTKPVITFDAGPFAHLYDIYLGTSPTPQLIAVNVPLGPNEGGPRSYQLPALAPGTTYYWRVVAKTMALQPTSGAVWRFTTAGSPGPAPAPLPSPSPVSSPDPGPAPMPSPRPAMAIDLPADGAAVRQPFAVAGWALDQAATDNGIDVVHAYAYPATGAPPIFLGAAPVNGARPDVAAVFGARHSGSGYGLTIAGLAPGSYKIVIFAHSSYGAGFPLAKFVTVRVEGTALVALDAPVTGAVVSGGFLVGGWAVDLAAPSGGGIDIVHVYAYPLDRGGAPVFLGAAPANVPRPDVGAYLGAAQFAHAGFNMIAPPLAPGRYRVVAFGRSVVSGTFAATASADIAVR